mmetsp:Transcript_5890/g.8619  ORF Transcript_5890/g.8619 Transcript_5890/m.8619 type:complete len:309 (+) Transcript_5890:528-1454(+)
MSIRSTTSIEDDLKRINDDKARLEAQRIELEEQGRYKEAQVIHNKLKQLSLLEGHKITKQVRSNHKQMQTDLVNQQTVEVDTFESVWSMKLEEYDKKAKEILLTTMDRQEWEAKETEQKIRQMLMMKKPKFSKKVLQYRTILKQLVKRKSYDEAEALRNQIKPLELKEMEKFQKSQEKTLKKKLTIVEKQHKMELEALTQRIQQGKNELLAQRQSDWKRLVQHHTNMMNEVTQKQKRILSNTKRIISTHNNVMLTSPTRANINYRTTFTALQPSPSNRMYSPNSPSRRSSLRGSPASPKQRLSSSARY